MSEVTSHAEVEPIDLGLLMGNSFTGFVDPSCFIDFIWMLCGFFVFGVGIGIGYDPSPPPLPQAESKLCRQFGTQTGPHF